MTEEEKDDKYLPDDDGSSEKPDEQPAEVPQHDPATDEVPE